MSVLDDELVRAEFGRAWRDSQPATVNAHEEGGFVLRSTPGSLLVERWPRGLQNEISVPPHLGGRRGELPIIATFHTHPNPEQDFQQEPSLSDMRAVRDDPDLAHPEFEGEYVIALVHIYLVRTSGDVDVIGSTYRLLGLS